jgi:hypothetical protein
MSGHIQRAQQQFLLMGGAFQFGLAKLQEDGVLSADYVYHEYPKVIRLSRGTKEFERATETCDKRTITWKETKEVFEDILVNSEDEEERVLSGGKTTTQMEEDRQGLIQRCRTAGIAADPSWSAVRLRRELGDALDAPAPGNDMAKLEAELANLRKMAAMQAEIEALRAQLGGQRTPDAGEYMLQANARNASPESDEIEELRAQLTALGVPFHHRHGVERLRDLLEAATAPEGVR